MQPEALGQVHPSRDHLTPPEKGVSSSDILFRIGYDRRGNHCVTAEGSITKTSIKANQNTSSNLDPGLRQLSLLSPEIHDLIYDLIPVEDNPDISSPCQPKELRGTSESLRRDLHRSSRPCTHVEFTFTCDVSYKKTIEDRYRWIQSKINRDAHAHNLPNIHRVEIVVTSSVNRDSPTLCFRIVYSPGDRKVIHI